MTMDRRQFLASSVATGALLASGCATSSGPGPGFIGPREHFQSRDLYSNLFLQMLALSPETATALGIDSGANAGLKSRLSDRAATGRTGWWGPLIEAMPQLRAVPAGMLTLRERAWLASALWFGERAIEGRSIPYGTAQTPYVITQLYGSYTGVPNFLDTQHTIETAADAQAYLDRLDAYHRNIDAEVAMAREDDARGVMPPNFIVEKALRQTRAALAQSGVQADLVTSLVRRTREKNIAGDWQARAVRIVDGPITAALTRQADLLEDQLRRAPDTAGVNRLPQGDEAYGQSLRYFTSTGMSAEQVHQLGLDEVARLTAEAAPLLAAQNIAPGPIGQRIAALERLPGQMFANTDPGREELLTYLRDWTARLRTRTPELFRSLPVSPMEVRRVPPAIEVGSAGAYAQGGNLEGTRPGIFYINLQDTSARPRFGLPTLTAHEAIPGHLWQDAIVNRATDIPMLFRATGISAFAEGWGLYSESLADELGMYEGDPLSRIGMIQSFLFRSARLVVDTGMHAKGWSREQAIRYFMDTVGRNRGATEREIDRYIVRPGQACAYKIGHNEMLRIREATKARLGARFDIKAYHDLVLLSGDMPLEVLAGLAGDWDGA